jgi:hypothetical protein
VTVTTLDTDDIDLLNGHAAAKAARYPESNRVGILRGVFDDLGWTAELLAESESCEVWRVGGRLVNLWTDAPSHEIGEGGLGFDDQIDWYRELGDQVASGFVLRDDGELALQWADPDSRWGFRIFVLSGDSDDEVDDERPDEYDGGVGWGDGRTWELLDGDDPRLSRAHTRRYDWLVDELRAGHL